MNTQKARIIVKRERATYGFMSIFNVVLDGRQIGRISNDSQECFEIEPGKHKFQCCEGMGFPVTEEIRFEVQSGESYEIILRYEGMVLLRILFPFLKKQRYFSIYASKK